MAVDPTKLKVSELTRLLNSTSQGEAVADRTVRRHLQRAGFRISPDGKTVNLFKYLAWLVDERHGPRDAPSPTREGSGYDGMKESARARNAAASLSGRDIGELPPVADPARKEACRHDFRRFCETYFPETFCLAWSEDHLKVISRIEQVVLRGGLYALAMPRGSGKTSLVETGAIWAVSYGHHSFVALIGATEPAACEMLDSIKMAFETNDLLADDFPEVCYPIRKLDGIANRCAGQLCQGKRTRITWTDKEIILPTIEGSVASSAIIRVAGITGRVRGMKYLRPDGRQERPTLVLPDDPQTDESAKSLTQCAARERVLAGAVLGLAGPGKKISGIMPCTVVCPGDMVDRMLDREKHPEWNGERARMVYSFPTNEKLWDEYAEHWADSQRAHGDISEATAFYLAHRAEMDAGAKVAWEARYEHDEASAIQHAMNLKLRDERAFWAEYQNEPLPEDTGAEEQLTADQVAQKLNGHTRRTVPVGCTHLTAFIDVQGKLLYWMVCAWEPDFTGYVVDYGAYPDQGRREFTLRDARMTLRRKAPGAGVEGAIYAGLDTLCKDLLETEWRMDVGGSMRVGRCLVDANWGTSTDIVYQFCRQSEHAAVLLPSHGRYVGASGQPFSEYRKQRGDQVGSNWRIPSTRGKRAIRHAVYDTNYWKSFVNARLLVPMGDRGCLSLYGRKPVEHLQLAQHLTAEYCVKTEGRGRTVDEWKTRPDSPDNHWWDALVGCSVAASILGAALPENHGVAPGAGRAPIKLSDLQKRKHSA